MAGEQFAQEGQRVRLKDGTEAIVQNGQLVAAPVKPGAGGGKKQSVQAQNFLNDLSKNAAAAREVGQLYKNVEGSMNTVDPGPYRNTMLLSPAIPEETGGWLDKLGAGTIGTIARLTGAVTPEETSAYQTMRAAQNAAVLERQLPQKGPQTESDAARMMLADISPNKDLAANQRVIEAGRQKIRREQAKAIFYTKFANNWGLNGVSPDGFTADQLWAKSADYITNKLLGPEKSSAGSKGKPQIKILSRTKVK